MPGTDNYSSVKAIESITYLLDKLKNKDSSEPNYEEKTNEVVSIIMSAFVSIIFVTSISQFIEVDDPSILEVILRVFLSIVGYIALWLIVNIIIQRFIIKKIVKGNKESQDITFNKVVSKFNSKIINELLVLSTLVYNFRNSDVSNCVKNIYLAEILEDSSRITSYISKKVLVIDGNYVSTSREIEFADEYISIYTFEAVYNELMCISWFLYKELIANKLLGNIVVFDGINYTISNEYVNLDKTIAPNTSLFEFAEDFISNNLDSYKNNLILKDYFTMLQQLQSIDGNITEMKKLD